MNLCQFLSTISFLASTKIKLNREVDLIKWAKYIFRFEEHIWYDQNPILGLRSTPIRMVALVTQLPDTSLSSRYSSQLNSWKAVYCPEFEWSKHILLLNGLDFEWQSENHTKTV